MEDGASCQDGERPPAPTDGRPVAASSWVPSDEAFKPYVPPPQSSAGDFVRSSSLRVIVKKSMVARLSKDIVETYRLCNPNFKYTEVPNRRRFLTNPSNGVLNDGFDNAGSDLIMYVNFVLVDTRANKRYVVKDLLGQGTFGQVAKCWVSETNSFVAVKVIKNQPAYYQQALVEVSLLKMLNQKFDPDDKHHIVRMLDYFVFQKHLCIAFELLNTNLFELIRMNHFKGLSLSIIQVFSKQILNALVVLRNAGIIHCDLKPENILVATSVPAKIKVIDFGSACLEGRTVYSYIQSRYYRSPEVLLGYPYTTSIDMWSFGCIVVELFLGLPLFPGSSEYDLFKRMIEILGGQPSDQLLRDSKNTNKFFKHIGSFYRMENADACKGSASAYRILTEEEYEVRESKKPTMGKRYFSYVKLEDIIAYYPYRKNLREDEILKEKITRLALVDFVRGLMEFDPEKRWSPLQASGHPFVTGEPFSCPYKPVEETPRIPVTNTIAVDHNPVGGHWLAAGLSPQVLNVPKGLRHDSSYFPMVNLSHGSYGSMGNHGSYNENVGLGSSFGSYGDVNYTYNYHPSICPSGLPMQAQVGGSLLGASPDTRRRPPQFTHGNGFGPSPGAGFGPMSLGASPSQFTPSTQMQMSTISPGKYGPCSPARGSVHGSPLGKGVSGQYNRRHWQYPGTLHMLPHDHTSQIWPVQHGDTFACNQSELSSRGPVCSPRSMLSNSNPSRQQRGSGRGFPSGSPSTYHNMPMPHVSGSLTATLHSSEVSYDKAESSSLPNPADWDPNYSDDLLLQEDDSEERSLYAEFENRLRLDKEKDVALDGSGRSRQVRSHNFANPSYTPRTSGAFQANALVGDASHSRDLYASHGRKQGFTQNPPTRFGQQPVHRNVQPAHIHNEWSRQNGEPPRPNYGGVADSHIANNMFSNSIPWGGRRTGHPIATIPPSSHARKDYGRIT